MDKKLILAVAGSGKTTYIIDRLDLDHRHLLITYTINNISNLRTKIIKKFGYFPDNIKLFSYYNFIYSFCYKPFLHKEISAKGINFKPNKKRFSKGRDRYVDPSLRLYSNRIPKFLETEGVLSDVTGRLSKYFDQILIDEIQDFGGHDFNFLKTIINSQAKIVFVGDFYQHTFDTSRDGSVNKSIHNDYSNYCSKFVKMGLALDADELNKSYRCSSIICDFISDNLDIKIESHRKDVTKIEFIENEYDADKIIRANNIIKIFYQNHHKYDCKSVNWGGCKGEDHYSDVCVVLNGTAFKAYKNGDLSNLAPSTKNKLYVALSRTRGDLYLVPDEFLKKHKTL